MYLETERLFLEPMQEKDFQEIKKAFASEERIKHYLPGAFRYYNDTQLKALLEDWNDEASSFLYSLKEKSSKKMIGLINLDEVSYLMRRYEMGVLLLDKNFEGKGYAREACQKILSHMFVQYQMHRVSVKVMQGNEASIKLFKNLGFKEEGRLRDFVWRDGKYLDMLLLSLLEQEWKG